jgi:hypothetical protein
LSSSSFHGTPCLVPAEFTLQEGVQRRGFITRLSHVAAALSSDPELPVGTQITLRFKRPSDGQPVAVSAGVREHLGEGGLWRGRPAALVAFHSPVELEEGEGVPTVEPLPAVHAPFVSIRDTDALDQEPLSVPPPALDDEAATDEQPAVKALGRALVGKGLGKRKLAGRLRRPSQLSDDEELSEDRLQSVPAHLIEIESAFFDDDGTAPPARHTGPIGEDDATMPPGVALDDFFSAPEPGAFGGVSEVPPVGGGLGSDEAFIAHFGALHESFGTDIPGSPDDGRPLSDPASLPPENIAPASLPASVVPRRPELASTGEAPPVRAPGTHAQAAGATRPSSGRPQQRSRSIPRASMPASRPPWEEELDDKAVASLIPRNARIASTVDVTFWARGRRNAAMADNFSREGLFLTFSGTPPVRGAVVRIEFPLEGSDESVPVRFNAEVRWHRSDRPGVGLADGFGVQILTFETPRDRARYAELLDAILALGPAPEPVEGFSWGRPGS